MPYNIESPSVFSQGTNMEHGSESFHVVEQLLPIALILLSAKIAGVLSLRIGMPSVFGELLVGLILGPAVLCC